MRDNQTFHRNAVMAGILFIIATAFLFAGEALYKPVLSQVDVLGNAGHDKQVAVAGILIEFICALAIPLIPVVLYPVLRLVSPVFAVGYLVFRLFEAVLLVGIEIDKLFVLDLSERIIADPALGSAGLEALSKVLASGGTVSGPGGPLYNLVFVIGMLMLNWMLLRSRLVPGWIAIWGLASALVLGGVVVIALFASIPDTLAIALVAPLAVQEMVLAFWLIFKGFDQAVVARLKGGNP